MTTTAGDLLWLASMQHRVASLHKAGQALPRLQRVLTVPPWGAHHALVSPFGVQRDQRETFVQSFAGPGLASASHAPSVRDNPHPEVPWAVYLHTADKYHRLTRRLSKEQNVL